jgi:hypothetical protein
MSRCASAAGYSLHANTSIPAGAPHQLERLFRYAGRPAIAEERLSELAEGRLLYRLKRPSRDGTTSVVFEPGDLLARLAALVPTAASPCHSLLRRIRARSRVSAGYRSGCHGARRRLSGGNFERCHR